LGAFLEGRHHDALGASTLDLPLCPRRLLLRGRIGTITDLDAQPLGFV
jgi:hypothetical protein